MTKLRKLFQSIAWQLSFNILTDASCHNVIITQVTHRPVKQHFNLESFRIMNKRPGALENLQLLITKNQV